jgi:GABA permease
MGRYLVVANQTLGGHQLIQAARERILHERSEFWVLVPETKSGRVDLRSGTDAASLAQQRLDMELQRLHEAGAEADGEVGDSDPFKAISNTLAYKQFDEIILSTLPHGRSRWLRQDLPGRVKKRFGIPRHSYRFRLERG